jgi:hypothetical protein
MPNPKKPKNGAPPEKVGRDAAIRQVKEMLLAASMSGRVLRSKEVMGVLGVSKPTALSYMQAAERAIATDGAAVVVEARLEAGEDVLDLVPSARPQRVALTQEQAMAVGVDMTGTLVAVKRRLESLILALDADLGFTRWVVMGGNASGSLPTRCAECNARHAHAYAGRPVGPHLLGPNAVALFGKLYSELIKANKAITEVVGEQNDVLEQFFSFEKMQQFMVHTDQAIREKADPDTAKAIAARIRELGSQS